MRTDLVQLEAEVKSLEEKYDGEIAKTSSVSPSQLDFSTLHLARGSLEINNRHSGVARHPLFYNTVKAMKAKSAEEMEKVMYEGSIPVTEEFQQKIAAVSEEEWDDLRYDIVTARNSNVAATTKTIKGKETRFSEFLSRRLTVFCASNKLPFVFSHQFSVGLGAASGGMEDTVDIAAFYYAKNLQVLLGFGEVKRVPEEKTKWQLCAYLSEAVGSEPLVSNVSVGLTINHNQINLYGFYWTKKEGRDRPLLEHSLLWSEPSDVTFNTRLLQCYFLCLAVLSDPDAVHEVNGEGFCPLVDEEVTLMYPKVLRTKGAEQVDMEGLGQDGSLGETVGAEAKTARNEAEEAAAPEIHCFKLYDYGCHCVGYRVPNVGALNVAYGKEKVKLFEDEECKVSVLKTPWFEGTHKPTEPIHVALLCDILQRLHTSRMKHGDVLCQNVIFGYHEGRGKKREPFTELIDFDYAHLSTYPLHWNDSFPERHPNAIERNRTARTHDTYAAIAILCMHFKLLGGDEDSLEQLFAQGQFTRDKHPRKSPSQVAAWIRLKKDTLVLRTVISASAKNDQTGSPLPKKEG